MLTKAAIDLTKLRMGRAHVFVGDLLTAGGMMPLGRTEGGITATPTHSLSTLTLPEETGDVPLDVRVTGGGIIVTIPLIVGDPTLWAKLSPKGVRGGGSSKYAPVVSTALLVVPESELDTNGSLAYGGTTPVWTPGAPEHAIFVWKGYFQDAERVYQENEDGAKTIVEATFVGMWDATAAEGYKVWAQGGAAAVAGHSDMRI